MNDIAEKIRTLSPEKRALLEKIISERKKTNLSGGNDDIAVVARNREYYELSSAQQRLWFMEQLENSEGAFNLHAALRFHKPLSLNDLRKSFILLLERHEVLRARFHKIDSQPFQTIEQNPVFDLSVTDLRYSTSESEVEHQLNVLIRAHSKQKFSLQDGSLLAASIVIESDNSHVLLIAMHHIVSDAWSMTIMLNELLSIYANLQRGLAPQLPPLSVQYIDYAVWQQQYLKSPAVKSQLDYWAKQLAGAPNYLDLPSDFPRPATQSYVGDEVTFTLPKTCVDALKNYAKSENVTLFMLGLLAYSIVLSKLSKQQDILIGTDIANRDQEQTEPLIGFFVNQLVLRCKLSPHQKVGEILQSIRKVCLDGYTNQHLPFNQLVEALNLPRDPSRSPLYQAKFMLQNTQDVNLEAMDWEAVILPEETSQFDILLALKETHEGVLGSLRYCKHLFQRKTCERMAERFSSIFSQLPLLHSCTLAEINLLTQDEMELLKRHNQTQLALTKNILFPLVDSEYRSATATAVSQNGENISYEQLSYRVDQLATYFAAQELAPGMRIAVCMTRSIDMLITLLAALRAGLCYIPLDPEYGEERLSYIIEDSEATLIVSCTNLPWLSGVKFANNITNIRTCIIDQQFKAQLPHIVTTQWPDPHPQQLAYTIYTSGSTGKPKGVAVPWQGVNNFLRDMQMRMGLMPGDRLLAVTTVAFDIAVLELFLPLVCGAEIVLATRNQAQDSRLLIDLIQQNNISHLQATPATWRGLHSVWKEKSLKLKGLVGGEALSPTVAEQMLTMCSEVINVYGPTETTIWSSAGHVTSAQIHAGISIGNPIGNTQLYVLDDTAQLTPFSCSGELFIGGHGVAQGYCNKPGLTAESFLPNPFSETPGARMYRTRDLVCRSYDGHLLYQGRNDSQIKIRGYRIELAEVEVVLQQYNASVYTAVATRQSADGDLSLVAFLQSEQGQDQREAYQQALSKFASEHLPVYMVPKIFIWLESMPLTANGKLDRKQLNQIATQFSPPKNEMEGVVTTTLEKKIAAIWTHVLNTDSASLNDDFFVYGGHSLLAIRLLDEVETATGQSVPLQEFFKQPSLSGLVREVSKNALTMRQYPVIEPDIAKQFDPFPLTNIQQAYLIGRSDAIELGGIATQNYIEINLKNLDVERFTQAWNRLIQRHGMMRAVFDSQGQQRILESVPYYQPEYSDFTQGDQQIATTLLEKTRAEMPRRVLPSDTGPLFELRISRLSEDNYRLHLVLDMLISDVTSTHILFTELSELYQFPDVVLPQLNISFRDYICAENQLKQSELYRQAKAYWSARVETFPSAPELPLRAEGTQAHQAEFFRRKYHIEKACWRKIVNTAKTQRISPTVILLTAFGETLSRWAAVPHFAINLTLFNRLPMHPEVNRLVGDFTSSLLLEQDHRGKGTFESAANIIQTQLWRDLDNKIFSGVEFIRELARTRGGANKAFMPVVFTSLLGLGSDRPEATDERRITSDFLDGALESAEEGYSVSQTSQVWLDHQVAEENGGVTLVWDALNSLFPEDMLDDMFSLYIERLCSLEKIESWGTTIKALPDHQALRRTQVNDTQVAVTQAYLHTAFEYQARINPAAAALISGSSSLTYQQLDYMSNALAHQLIDAGAHRNSLVAVCMEKSKEQIIAVLGILKSGAAYLPIDANLPKQRQYQLLEQGECRIVLTQAQHLETWTQSDADGAETITTLVVDNDLLLGNTSAIPCKNADWTDIAYVIFTSGSTGIPKGVVIDHRGAVNTVEDINRRFKLSHEDVVFALSSLSFDLSVFDIFGLLSVGGSIVIPEASETNNPVSWWKSVEAHSVTVWNTVPALMQLLVNHGESLAPTSLAKIRLVMMSGDWIPVSLPDRIKILSASCEIISLGGATEASIWSIFHPVTKPSSSLRSIPYGKPLANQSFYVLDKDLYDCPDWVAGDLYVGGMGLAKGYWKDDQRTSASFINCKKYGRLYRTGDLGRYIENGDIEFLGRDDGQVKIQGFRVELGEIEGHLLQHPAVADAVVSVIGDVQESKTLVAYLVPKSAENVIAGTDGNDVLLSSSVARSSFKLQQKGIRKFSADKSRIILAKPNKAWAIRKSSEDIDPTNTWLERFGKILGVMRAEAVKDAPLPKYFYPSASSLYPIQLYVYIDETLGAEFSGFYYYSSVENALIKLGDSNPIDQDKAAEPTLYWLVDWDAILPMYENHHAGALIQLEAGYMSELLETQAVACKTVLRTQWFSERNPEDQYLFSLSTDLLPVNHQVIAKSFFCATPAETVKDAVPRKHFEQPKENRADANQDICLPAPSDNGPEHFSNIERQSYREFLDTPVSLLQLSNLLVGLEEIPLQILVLLKDSSDDENESAWFIYLADQRSLRPLTSKKVNFPFVEIYGGGENNDIFKRASFALFFLGHHARDNSINNIDAGKMGQRMLATCWNYNIGLCPIGYLDEEKLRSVVEIPVGTGIVHSMLGGVISDDQPYTWQPQTNSTNAPPTEQDFIAYLERLLPKYMVPRVYIPIAVVPLTTNGKVDRKSLPKPDLILETQEHKAAKTPLEKVLVKVWSRHLSVAAVGISDNFFSLGGNSLMAMQLISELRTTHNINCALRDLFENPTISQLSTVIKIDGEFTSFETTNLMAVGETDIYSLENVTLAPANLPKDVALVFPISLAQQHMFSVFEMQDDKSTYNIPAALNIRGAMNAHHLHQALIDIVQRHEALRSVFRYIDGELCQCVLRDAKVSWQEYDIRHVSDASIREHYVDTMLEQDALADFDLHTGPLIRAHLIHCVSDEHVLMLNVHHIVSDFLSMDIIVRELGTLYTAYCVGDNPSLPRLALQFSHFTMWQKQFLQSTLAASQLDFWMQYLNNIPKLTFPDEAGLEKISEKGGWHKFEFSHDLLISLKNTCKKNDVTFFMLGLASIQQLIESITGTTDVAIGTPFSTRFNADLENVVGLMLNTLVIRISSHEVSTVTQLLEQVKIQCLNTFSCKDLPFERVQNELRKLGKYTEQPLYRVRYVYRKISDDAAENTVTDIVDRPVKRTSAKFDILVTLNESEDRLFGEIEYRSDVWNHQTIETLSEMLERTLSFLAQTDEQKLNHLQKDLRLLRKQSQERAQASLRKQRSQSLVHLVKQKNHLA